MDKTFIVNQPTSKMPMPVEMMTNPQFWGMMPLPLNVPYGLEYLTTLNHIFVKQKIELMEVIFGCEAKNKYEILDGKGQLLFKAKEETGVCTRICCGTTRPFDIEIKDLQGREIVHLDRPLACQSMCYPCCLQVMTVSSPPGQIVGSIHQQWSCCPSFVVKDNAGQIVLRIKGPFFASSCCCRDVAFEVFSADGNSQVGQISKIWSGLLKEAYTDADNFVISFPRDMDVRIKATLIGACFLIDFMYFEEGAHKRN